MFEKLKLSISDAEFFDSLRIASAIDGENDSRIQYLGKSNAESRQWDFPAFTVRVTVLPECVVCLIEMKLIAVVPVMDERRAA